MQKGPLAVLALCGIVIVVLTIWLYSETNSAASLLVLLVLMPFGLFGYGISKVINTPRQSSLDDDFQDGGFR